MVLTNLKNYRKGNIECIDIPQKRFGSYIKKTFSGKLLVFLYSSIVRLCETGKVKGIPISKKINEKLNGIKQEGYVIHHLHITGEIIGYAHPFAMKKLEKTIVKHQ